MFGRVCPYCKEHVKKAATACRFCGRDLDPAIHGMSGFFPLGVFVGFAGLAAGAALAFLWGYSRERLRWRDKELQFPGSAGPDDDTT